MPWMLSIFYIIIILIPIIVIAFFFGKSKCDTKKKFVLALCDIVALVGTIFTLIFLHARGLLPLMMYLCAILPLLITYGLTIYILQENNESVQDKKIGNYGSNYTQ